MQLEQALKQAKCTFPFAHLGAFYQSSNAIFTVTTWLPNAEKVSVIDLASGKSLGSLIKVEGSHLFRGEFKVKQAPPFYAFDVTNKQGQYQVVDPYQFQEQAYHAVHFIDHSAQNVYQQIGAQLVDLDVGLDDPIQATRFAVFAPNASAVSLIGEFNYWDGSCLPMQKTDIGYWVLVVPGIEAGAKYKYQLKDCR
jgi:1,4-alpha-glucan branching enzyme